MVITIAKDSNISEYAKEEISCSLWLQERNEKIVLPILYKIKPNQISLDNAAQEKLLNIYVSLRGSPLTVRQFCSDRSSV